MELNGNLSLGLLTPLPAPLSLLSYGCIGLGLWFWLWGTWPLLGDRSVLYKLHGLSVSDTLGSMLIIVGLLWQIPREWPLLILALISLAIWNTVLGYVLAYCSANSSSSTESLIPMTDAADRVATTLPSGEMTHD